METRDERLARLAAKHEAKASRLAAEAAARFKRVDTMAGIMNGTPVLIGHHSEKRHRRDLQRMDDDIRKGVEASRQAGSHRHLAEHPRPDISTQDADASELIEAKIRKLEHEQEVYRAVNAVVRSKPRNELTEDKVARIVKATGWSEGLARRVFEKDFCGRVGFPPYMLSNNNANIRRLRERLAKVEAVRQVQDGAVVAEGTCEGKAFRFVTDLDDGRIRFEAPRLSRDACRILRRSGFKWSPQRGAWVRLLTQDALSAVRHWIAPDLAKRAVVQS